MISNKLIKFILLLAVIIFSMLLIAGCTSNIGKIESNQSTQDNIPNIVELENQKDIEGLIKALGYKSEEKSNKKDSQIRLNAAYALGRIGEPAVEPLIEALKNENIDVRSGAATALGNIGDLEAVEPLIEALNDENSKVRYSAAYALGDIGDARAVEPLIETFDDEDATLQLSVRNALAEIGEAATEPLIEALNDENSEVQKMAADTLIKIGDVKAIEPLIDYLNKYGDKSLAETFLNCGNVRLEKAASSWASEHGYTVLKSSGGSGPSWGK